MCDDELLERQDVEGPVLAREFLCLGDLRGGHAADDHGWPVLIPPTSRDTYLSGYHALNFPPLPGEPASGDWHQAPTWWSPTHLDAYGLRPQAPLWTAVGEPYV